MSGCGLPQPFPPLLLLALGKLGMRRTPVPRQYGPCRPCRHSVCRHLVCGLLGSEHSRRLVGAGLVALWMDQV